MIGPGTKVDFTAYRHPVLAVPCPECKARPGAVCVRPSGHNVFAHGHHAARKRHADEVHEQQRDPDIVNTAGGKQTIGLGIWRYA